MKYVEQCLEHKGHSHLRVTFFLASWTLILARGETWGSRVGLLWADHDRSCYIWSGTLGLYSSGHCRQRRVLPWTSEMRLGMALSDVALLRNVTPGVGPQSKGPRKEGS